MNRSKLYFENQYSYYVTSAELALIYKNFSLYGGPELTCKFALFSVYNSVSDFSLSFCSLPRQNLHLQTNCRPECVRDNNTDSQYIVGCAYWLIGTFVATPKETQMFLSLPEINYTTNQVTK